MRHHIVKVFTGGIHHRRAAELAEFFAQIGIGRGLGIGRLGKKLVSKDGKQADQEEILKFHVFKCLAGFAGKTTCCQAFFRQTLLMIEYRGREMA